jgi:ribosomal protein S18 acetylase RimI-like enzyme
MAAQAPRLLDHAPTAHARELLDADLSFAASSADLPRTLQRIDPVKVRQARDEDARSIAEIHIRSWQAAYRGILSDVLLDGLSVSERETSWRALLSAGDGLWLTLVAECDGGLAGFCSVASPSRDVDASERTAEIGALYVDPSQWRRGAGGAMLMAALDELRTRRYRDVILWVLPENHAALTFYGRFDFEVEEGIEKREERSGRSVIRLRATLPASSS